MTSELPTNPNEPTVLMASSSVARAPDKPAAPVRQLYVVRPAGEQWEVVAGHSGEVKLFAVKAEALLAARSDARARWSTLGLPGRVSLEIDGTSLLVALYGSDTPPA